MKIRIKENLWRFDINTRFGRHRTRRGEEFHGSADEANKEILRIKSMMKKKTKKNILLDKSACRTMGDCLIVYKQDFQKIDENKIEYNQLEKTRRNHIWNNLFDNMGNVFLPNAWASLERHVAWMKTKKNRYDKDFSIASINRIVDMAKAAVKLCYIKHNEFGERLIPENFLEGFEKEPEFNIRYKILSDDEIQKLHSNLPDYLQPLYYYACRVPARITELTNLKKFQINLFNRMIVLEDGTTKTGPGRWLPIFPETYEFFESVMHLPTEYVFMKFVKSRNRYERILTFHKAWASACEASGINPNEYNFHKTRQQAAMEMLREGFSEMETMTIGGWRSREAFRRYVRMDEEMLKIKMGLIKYEMPKWRTVCAPIKIKFSEMIA